MLRVMSATDSGSMRRMCIASRRAVRRPTPGSFESSPTTFCKSCDISDRLYLRLLDPPPLAVGDGDLAPVVEAVGDLHRRPLVQHEQIGRRPVGRALHRDRRGHHHGLRAVEDLAPRAQGEERGDEAEHRRRDHAAEARLAQRQPRREQIEETAREHRGQQPQREQAPRRAPHQVAHRAHPGREAQLGDPLDGVLGAGLRHAEVVAHVLVAGLQAQRTAVAEDRLTQALLLEAGVAQVVVEFGRALAAREQQAVGVGSRAEVAGDVGLVGAVPQPQRGRRRDSFGGFGGRSLGQRVGTLLRRERERAQQRQRYEDDFFHDRYFMWFVVGPGLSLDRPLDARDEVDALGVDLRHLGRGHGRVLRLVAAGDDRREALLQLALGAPLVQLLAHVLFREVGHGDVEAVAHVAPERPQHLLVEGVAVLLLHVFAGRAEALHGHLVGPAAAHERQVVRLADALAQQRIGRAGQGDDRRQQRPIDAAEEERTPLGPQMRSPQTDEADVLPQQAHLLLRHAAPLHHHRLAAARAVGRDLHGQRLRTERLVAHARGIEVGELHRLEVVVALGARDERVFELPVAGDARRRGVDRLDGLDVVLLERTGQRQAGRLHEGEVARARDLHRVGGRRVGRQPLGRQHGLERELPHGAAEARPPCPARGSRPPRPT